MGYSLYECSVVWFLVSLFISINILNILLGVKTETKRLIVVICCVVVGYICFKMDFIYFCIPQGLIAVGYCYIGYVIKEYKLVDKFVNTDKMRKILIIVILSIVTLLSSWRGSFAMAYGVFEHGFVDYLGAGCSGVLFLGIGIFCGNIEWRGLDGLKKVGVYTYWLMCIHSIEMTCIPWYYWSGMMKNKQTMAFCLEAIVKFLIMLTICKVLKFMLKIKYQNQKSAKYITSMGHEK